MSTDADTVEQARLWCEQISDPLWPGLTESDWAAAMRVVLARLADAEARAETRMELCRVTEQQMMDQAAVLGERLIIHSAYQADTAKEAFRRLVDLIESRSWLEQEVQLARALAYIADESHPMRPTAEGTRQRARAALAVVTPTEAAEKLSAPENPSNVTRY